MIIKITRRSISEFQFGDDQPIVKLDVIEISDQWHEINFAMRVHENDMWVVPVNKINEHGQNRLNFVQGLVNDAYEMLGVQVPTLTRAEAEEFIKCVGEETDKLRNFIFAKSVKSSSVPESTEEGNFSQ